MRNNTIFLFLILVVAAAAFGQRAPRQIYPDKMSIKGMVEMPLNVRGHLPVIEAKLNGKGPFRLELDTGFGGMVQLKESVVSQLDMPVIGEARSGDPSGRNPVTVRLLRANSVNIGAAHFEGVVVSETKRDRAPDLDGVIGLSLFHKLKVQVDYVSNRFVLTEGSISQTIGLAYTAEQGVPEIEIVVNGTKAKVHIDSGSPGEVTLPLSMAKSLTLKAEPTVVGRGQTADGDFEVFGASLKGEVTVGDIILKDPMLDFLSVFPLGNLGFRFLKTVSVTFDPANKRVLFERNRGPSKIAELTPAIDAMVNDLAKRDQFSGVVMVAKDDRPIYAKAWGMADADKKLANKIDTRFNLGSINKMFTRIAIGQLVSQGKLSYSDKLIKVLPDYPNRAVAEKITIGQMITMSSGLGDFFNKRFETADKSKIRSQNDYLPFFVNDPLEFEPGTNRRYSNAGYLVLGLVIEKLSGKSYYDYVRENIFKPAGMTATDSYAMDELPSNTAIGYASPAPGKRISNAYMQPARGSSAGGGYSTADDMLQFANALKAKKLVLPNDDGTLPTEFSGTGMAGGSPGINAIFITNAVTGYTVIVLSNIDPPSAETIGTSVRDWLKQLKQ